jgi:hypothetical protein
MVRGRGAARVRYGALIVAVASWLGCSTSASGPPGEKTMQKSDAELVAYQSFLQKSGKPTDSMNENQSLRKGDWRYFFRGDRPGFKSDEAAVSSRGEVIDRAHQPAWYAFLSQTGVSASELVQRYCWLHGQLAAVDPGDRFFDARIASQRCGADGGAIARGTSVAGGGMVRGRGAARLRSQPG